ncbi:MAG TPA: anthranilate phosphoribosyltransferase [Gemmatimonadales bacterium]|nr:anthranilate phosphoribosyltransferase [Gemmatimonadales bacterium]
MTLASFPAKSALAHALRQLAAGASLTAVETAAAFGVVMRGEATPVQVAALLMGLRAKGECAEEIAGAASALRTAMVPFATDRADELVDTCGTGGGSIGTINVSTAAAFVVAGTGVPVAKHGNRSYTSRSGSADVLEALGVEIMLPPPRAVEVLREVGLVFLFAPSYHPAMRHVAPTRGELGVPTIMNLVGPLANPGGVRRQVVGVSDRARAPLVAEALRSLGAAHALVVHGLVGMDEISPCGVTLVWEVRDGRVAEWTIEPAAFGLACDDLTPLAGGVPAENAIRIERLLGGGGGSAMHRAGGIDPARAAVQLNAAAALYVAGRGLSFLEAVRCAGAALDDGRGAAALERLREAAPAVRAEADVSISE